MAFGTATPDTMFHPCVANSYEPCSVWTLQVSGAIAARAVADVPSAILAIRLANAHANRKQLVMLLSNFVFMIILLSNFLSCFGLL